MTSTEISQKILELFFECYDTEEFDAIELTEERSLDIEEFDELIGSVVSIFDVSIPVRPLKYVWAPPDIDNNKFSIQQLSDYVATLLNKQKT